MAAYILSYWSTTQAILWIVVIAALSPARAWASPSRTPVYGSAHPAPIRSEDGPPIASAAGVTHLLYLNRCRGGLTVTKSSRNDSTKNHSSVLKDGQRTLPEYPYGDESWNELVVSIRALFAPFNIAVTDVDPSPAPHDEAVVCGTSFDLLPATESNRFVGGVAPMRMDDCKQIENAMTFTFAEMYGGDINRMAATVAQEAAHAWGLDHLMSCNDPMTYLGSPWGDEGECWPKAFQDREIPCGDGRLQGPRECYCGGTTRNSYRWIMNMFGPAIPDSERPTAQIVSPRDGDTIRAGSSFNIEIVVDDDVSVSSVTLLVNGISLSTDATLPFERFFAKDTLAGTYELEIVARDIVGNETKSAPIVITVGERGPFTFEGIHPDDEMDNTGVQPGSVASVSGPAAAGCSVSTRSQDRWAHTLFVLLALLGLRPRKAC